ncbi:hypothetical protein M3Y97_00794500 [Aphelenchoides bicaudatus]|nr:hypothetical protein M3Y97_00794500 [Aphelenchoides bicaudatus]
MILIAIKNPYRKIDEYQTAGFLMLLGQATDAAATPIIGLLSDASILPWFLMRFGRRKAWHIIGTTCVSLSFPFIYTDCLVCKADLSSWLRVLWFIPFIMIFQFGWAATQIAHLALIPELSTDPGKRGSMNSCRNAFTVVANLTIYLTFFFLLKKSEDAQIVPDDLVYFQVVGFGTVALGLSVTGLFYFFVKEPLQIRMRPRMSSFSSETTHVLTMSWRCWQVFSTQFLLSRATLYALAVVRKYLPSLLQFLHNTCSRRSQILFSFLASLEFLALIGKLNRKALFMGGSLIGVAISFPLYFLYKNEISIYFVTCLMGISQALLLISSLGMTAQLINKNTESGAFVYGIMSFVDKLSNGVVVQAIQLFIPNKENIPGLSNFYRNIMSWMPGAFTLLTIVVLLFLNSKRLGRRDTDTSSTTTQDLITEPIEIED